MTGSVATEESFVIGPTHPALPGHFPDLPVVPGVVLVDQVVDAAERWLEAKVYVESIQQIKFLHPLKPGQKARTRLDFDGTRTLRFQIDCAEVSISQGTLGIRVERHA